MLVHERLAFSPEEYIRRYDVIQEAMARMELDALLVRGPENITYVIGYETPGYYKYHCVIIPRLGEPVFLVRDFEWLNTPEFAWSGRIAKVYDWDHPPSVTANILKQLGLNRGKRIGAFEERCARDHPVPARKGWVAIQCRAISMRRVSQTRSCFCT